MSGAPGDWTARLRFDPTAFVAPGAVVVGDVTLGARAESLQDNIEADMLAIQRNPGLVRSFFRAPYVAYITD